MCTGLEAIIGGALGLLGSVVAPKPKAPPPPEMPATPADAARAAGATVRVGDGQDRTDSSNGVVENITMPETRVFGKPVGGLGKSGLSI